jgi:predicted nucleic acid-binding Zn ribbon protein
MFWPRKYLSVCSVTIEAQQNICFRVACAEIVDPDSTTKSQMYSQKKCQS